MKTDLLIWIFVNIASILFIVLIVFLWQKHQPMTAAKAQKTVMRLKLQKRDTPPCDGDFCRIRTLLTVLDGSVPQVNTLAAILTDWAVKDYITLQTTPKKRLKSFGDSEQESIVFNDDCNCCLSGAEQLIFEMFKSWTDESNCLQKSELYIYARNHASEVIHRIEQFSIQGKHALRSSGEMYPEKKRRHLGFIDEQRLIFTDRGVRELGYLRDYRFYLSNEDNIQNDSLRDAVLFNIQSVFSNDICKIALNISQTIINASTAGIKSIKN